MAHRQYVVNLSMARDADYFGDIKDMVGAGVMWPIDTQQETERIMQSCGDTHPDSPELYHPDGHITIRTRWVTKWEEQDA